MQGDSDKLVDRRRLRRLEVAHAQRHGDGRSRRQGDRAGQADRLACARSRPPPTSSSRTAASSSPAPTGRSASWSWPRSCAPASTCRKACRPRSTCKHVSDGPGASAYPNGCHVCEVEIDPETGVIEVVKYSAVNDFGTVVNPMIVEGQLHGGVVQGIGQALMEMHGLRHARASSSPAPTWTTRCRARSTRRCSTSPTIRCRPRPIRSASRAAAKPAAPAR